MGWLPLSFRFSFLVITFSLPSPSHFFSLLFVRHPWITPFRWSISDIHTHSHFLFLSSSYFPLSFFIHLISVISVLSVFLCSTGFTKRPRRTPWVHYSRHCNTEHFLWVRWNFFIHSSRVYLLTAHRCYIFYWTSLDEKTWLSCRRKLERKVGAYAMEREAAGAHLLITGLFEPAKRPDDRSDYCLGFSFLP